MTVWTVLAYVNAEPGMSGIMRGYREGDRMAFVDVFTFDGGADQPSEIAERMFAVGNGVGADDRGQHWPPDVRSLSVGDYLHLTTPGQAVALTTAPVGWRVVAVRPG